MNKPQNRNENIVVQKFQNEILIYDLRTNKACCLNETSALVWQLCDGTKTVGEISQSLTKQLKQPITEDVVWLALDDFKERNLLTQSEQFEINFSGLNRRQVIKKVGFASLIALPIVLSAVAPTAAAAASGTAKLALYEICPNPNGNASCQSGNCVSTDSGYRCCVPGGGSFTNGQGSCSTFANCTDYGTNQCCSGKASPYPAIDGTCSQIGRTGCQCNA